MANVALTLPAVLLALAGIELVAYRHETFRDRAAESAAHAAGLAWDARAPLGVVRELRRAGDSTAVAFFRQPVAVAGRPVLPLGGIANVTTVFCNERGSYVVYRADELGFNNPRGLWTLPDSTLAVALVGDSFTHGVCVPTDSTLGGRIRRVWPRTVSLGFGGNGPLTQLAGIHEHVAPRAPRFVVWVYFENDLDDLRHEARSAILSRYERGAVQGLEASRAAVDAALAGRFDALLHAPPRRGGLRNFVRLTSLRNAIRARRSQPPPCCDVPRMTAILAQAAARVRGWGGELVFVYLPDPARFDDQPGTAAMRAWPAVRRAVDSLGLRVVDGEAALRTAWRDPRDAYSYRFGHLNARGYDVVAAAILAVLAQPIPRAPGGD